jgi:aminopeptidase N
MFGAGQDGDLPSTYLVAATAQGFWQPEQRVLLAPFVARYFPATVQVAARRGAWVAAAVAGSGFPFHDIDEATLRAAERALADGAGTATLQRQLADRLDDFRRALRVRRREPAGSHIGCAPCRS